MNGLEIRCRGRDCCDFTAVSLVGKGHVLFSYSYSSAGGYSIPNDKLDLRI